MHESAITEVNADVREFFAFLVEEHQITFNEFVRFDRDADFSHRSRITWKRNTDLLKAIVDKSAAIEAGPLDAAVAIRRAEHRQRMVSGVADVDAYEHSSGVGRRRAWRRAGTSRD